MGIADTSGTMMATDGTITDTSDRVHFTRPMSGESTVSDPIISKKQWHGYIGLWSPPIKENGQIVGVLIAVRDW